MLSYTPNGFRILKLCYCVSSRPGLAAAHRAALDPVPNLRLHRVGGRTIEKQPTRHIHLKTTNKYMFQTHNNYRGSEGAGMSASGSPERELEREREIERERGRERERETHTNVRRQMRVPSRPAACIGAVLREVSPVPPELPLEDAPSLYVYMSLFSLI